MKVAQTMTGQLVVATADLSQRAQYCCPKCQQPVVLKKGATKAPYFAHQTSILGHGESQIHQLGKQAIGQLAALLHYQVQYEVAVNHQQRADVLLQKQQPVVIEYQCSPLTITQLTARTHGYQASGLTVWWVVGQRYWPQHHHLSAQQLAFIQYRPDWGFYLVGYQPQQQQWLLYHHIVTFDFNGYWWQVERLNYHQWAALLQRPQQLVIRNYRKPTYLQQQQQLQKKLVRMQPDLMALQAACYQRGYRLQAVPRWCYCRQWVPPIYQQSQFSSRVAWWLTAQTITDYRPQRLHQPLLPAELMASWGRHQLNQAQKTKA